MPLGLIISDFEGSPLRGTLKPLHAGAAILNLFENLIFLRAHGVKRFSFLLELILDGNQDQFLLFLRNDFGPYPDLSGIQADLSKSDPLESM